MNIDEAIKKFSEFLNASWDVIYPILLNRSYTLDESSISDWLQANWELLVERNVLDINEYLEVYGDGADFNGASSRITDVDSYPTYKIKIIGKNKEVLDVLNHIIVNPINLIFDSLVGFENGFYVLSPPFNYVLTLEENTDIERVLQLEEIQFELQKISNL